MTSLKSNPPQWKQSGDFLWKKKMKGNWIQTTFLTFIWFLWRCVKALESEIRLLLCRGNRSRWSRDVSQEWEYRFFFFKMVLLELILQTMIPGPNQGSRMVVITSWLRTLKTQTLLTPGKAHEESWHVGMWVTLWWMDLWWNTVILRPPPPPNPHQTVLLFLRGTGCITPPALGKMSAWCSKFAASAASFLITFALLELTVSCLLLSKGAWILKPAARKWNCWNSRCFHQLWRKGRQRDDWLLGNPHRLIKQEEVMIVFTLNWIISLWESHQTVTQLYMHFSIAAAPWQTVP